MFFRTAARVCAAAFISAGVAVNVASAQALTDAPPVIAGARAASAPAIVLDGPPAPVAPAVVNRDDKGRATLRATRIGRPLDDRRPARRGSLRECARRGRFRAAAAAREPAGHGSHAVLGLLRRQEPVYLGALPRQPSRTRSRDRAAPRQQQHHPERKHHHRPRYLLRPAQRLLVPDQPARRHSRPIGRRRHGERELEHRMGRPVGARQPGMDDRDGDPVQVAALRGIGTAGVGHQRPPDHHVEERDRLSQRGAGGVRQQRRLPDECRRHARGCGNAAAVDEPGAEAVRRVVAEHRSRRVASLLERLREDGGFDFKYGLTRGLVLDATVNTDFAQVEEDAQQVNLTRFSLFFPEKRDFFLEGEGIFGFGGAAVGERSGNGTVPRCRSCSSAGRSG